MVSGKPAGMLVQTARQCPSTEICLVLSFSLFANRNRLRLSIGWGALDSFILVSCSLFSFSETTLSKEGIRGSKLEATLEYTHLKPYEVSSRTDEQEFLDKYEKPTEESPGKECQSSF